MISSNKRVTAKEGVQKLVLLAFFFYISSNKLSHIILFTCEIDNIWKETNTRIHFSLDTLTHCFLWDV
jgi:hypothetical protein